MKNPVEDISAHLQEDMTCVNTIILARMDSHVPLVNQLAGYLIAAGESVCARF